MRAGISDVDEQCLDSQRVMISALVESWRRVNFLISLAVIVICHLPLCDRYSQVWFRYGSALVKDGTGFQGKEGHRRSQRRMRHAPKESISFC
jgi:hypothetical protein